MDEANGSFDLLHGTNVNEASHCFLFEAHLNLFRIGF